MPRCPCRDFRMAENKLQLLFFLHKKPVRNSILEKFSTCRTENLLELQIHVLFVNRDSFYYCS